MGGFFRFKDFFGNCSIFVYMRSGVVFYNVKVRRGRGGCGRRLWRDIGDFIGFK